MSLELENNEYNPLSKILHWVTALLIFGLLFLGFYMEGLAPSDYKYEMYDLHKSFGVIVIALAFLRILWHIIKRKPKHINYHKPWERFLSSSIHLLIYVALFAVPLSGWAMSSTGGYAVNFFGLGDLPALLPKDKQMFELFGEIHEISAYALLFIVGLHMLGAFKHHFIDRDETLKRMTNKSLGLIGGIVVLLLAIAAYAPAGFYVAQKIFAPKAVEKPHNKDDHAH